MNEWRYPNVSATTRIAPLAEHPQAIPLLAEWFHREWFRYDGRSIRMIERQLGENLNRDRIPITFLALRGSTMLGTVSLDLYDLPSHDHLSPWLASLFVLPSARREGIGSALVTHVQHFASSHGVSAIHLWTPGSTRLYERCGWTVLNRAIYGSRPITLMCSQPVC